jgi:hypothetical protein
MSGATARRDPCCDGDRCDPEIDARGDQRLHPALDPATGLPTDPVQGRVARAPRLGAVVAAMVVVLLLLTGGGYVGLTWSRAEEVCAEEVAFDADRAAPSSVDVAWSWRPLGVRCTGDDGSRTSLWWGMHDH